MSWRDQLQSASFRDVPFFVSGTDAELGRRVQVHEYPLRDKPYVEDLGRKTRRFTLECYVLGQEYMAARDALIAALEQPGSGELVHRYLGQMNVVVESSRGPRESTREGGMAAFSITFVEAGERLFPSEKPSTVERTDAAATAASAAAQAEFAQAFSVEDQPAFVLDAATGVLQQASSAVREALGAVNSATAPITEFIASIDEFDAALTNLIQTPDVLAAQVASLIGSIATVADTALDALHGCKTLLDFGSGLANVGGSAGSLQRRAENQTAILNLMRQVALAEAGRQIAMVAFESAEQAQEERDDLLDAIDTQALDAADGIFTALDDLRAAVVTDIAQRILKLPQLSTYVTTAVLPALVLAQRLYGDVARADELIARNRIRHPGFVPGGTALQVIDA